MTVHTELVKLKVQKEYQKRFKKVNIKPRNIDIIWYEHEPDVNEQYVQLVTTNQHPVLGSCGTRENIDTLLSKMPVKQDAVRDRKNTPKGPLHPVSTIVTHPGLNGSRDFLRSRMKNVRDKWVTRQKLLEINAKMKSFGYTKGIEVEEVVQHPTKPISYYRIKIGEVEYE
jgi:hypothetical protein